MSGAKHHAPPTVKAPARLGRRSRCSAPRPIQAVRVAAAYTDGADHVATVTANTAGTLDATPPAATGIDVPADGAYGMGLALTFTVHFGAAVTVTGTPGLALTKV